MQFWGDGSVDRGTAVGFSGVAVYSSERERNKSARSRRKTTTACKRFIWGRTW